MKKLTRMTLREWTIAYDLAFGRAQLSKSHAPGERVFLMNMFGDLGGELNVIVLLTEEYRRMDDELAHKTTEEMCRVSATNAGESGQGARDDSMGSPNAGALAKGILCRRR